MEKTEQEKPNEQNPTDFFLERPFDVDEHIAKLKNKSAYLLNNENEKTFKTIHFFYDETCKENKTFSEKKIEKITWKSNLIEKNFSKKIKKNNKK